MDRRGFLKSIVAAPAIVSSKGVFTGACDIWLPPGCDKVIDSNITSDNFLDWLDMMRRVLEESCAIPEHPPHVALPQALGETLQPFDFKDEYLIQYD